MTAAPKTTAKTPAQAVAAKATKGVAAKTTRTSTAGTGRSKKPRTAKQRAAALKWAAAGRAAQKAAKKKAPVKKPAAPLNLQLNLGPEGLVTTKPAFSLEVHQLPACAPVALAEHLRLFTGITAADDEIAALHERLGLLTLADLFEAVAAEGLAGLRLGTWTPCDVREPLPGLLYGLQLRGGYHAVLAHPAGMISWGTLLPWPREPDEAWHLEWVPA